MLGVPTVADRVAQTVAYLYLEPEVEPVFHPDSYGYRPRRSAHDALRACRQRCWKYDWAIDLDLRAFFDSLDHSLVLKAVAHHTNLRWILLYVERWLKAPLQLEDGTLKHRDRGSPQGSAISPVLANLFLHYALDMWLVREFPAVPFERYADDAILHCKSKAASATGARRDHRAVGAGRSGAQSGQDAHRVLQGLEPHAALTSTSSSRSCGYTFRPRRARSKAGEIFVSFLPAVSGDAAKEMRRTIKRWRLHLWSGKTLADLAQEINSIVRGWINYYGRFYRTELIQTLKLINDYLVRWAMRKYKRLRGHPTRAWRFLTAIARTRARPVRPLEVRSAAHGWMTGAR